jgi:DNA-binding MurR/RpiR family transcriptional regulator
MLKIEKTIKKGWKNYTPSEQKLASFFLNHLNEVPFETAASISKRVDVSPMTVGRYIKKLGYADLRDIKLELRAHSGENGWNGDDVFKTGYVSDPLKAKIQGLIDVYKLPQSPDWNRIVSLIVSAPRVYVASFQVGRFMGLGFATFLQTLRPNVYFSDSSDGSYADVLLDPGPGSCLILIDFRRYSRHFRMLAEEAAARNIRTIVLTDVYCHWARALTDNVLMIETDFGIRSLSMGQILFELLLASIASELKDSGTRVETVHQLRQKFVGFVGSEDDRRRKKVQG